MKTKTMKIMAAFLCAILVFMNSGMEQMVYASSIEGVSGNDIVTEPPLLDEDEKEDDEAPDTENEEETAQEPVENTEEGEEEDFETGPDGQLSSNDIDVYAADLALASAGGEVTRAAWISKLVEAFHMSVEEDNYPDNYYSDISSSDSYYRDIMLAVEFGVIDLEAGEEFRPNDPASRDFAASTLNYCLGFQLEEPAYEFSDSAGVGDPDSAQIAVNRGWITLSDGRFMPDQPITSAEASRMISDAQNVLNASDISDSYNNQVSFADGVIVVPEGTGVSLDDEGNVIIKNCPVTIKAGDIFAVYMDIVPAVYKALSVSVDGDMTTIEVTEEGTEDAITSMDVEGTVEVELESFIPSEGQKYYIGNTVVESDITTYGLSYDKTKKVLTASKSFTLSDSTKIVFNAKISNLKIDKKIDIRNSHYYLKVYGDVEYSTNANWNGLESLGIPNDFVLGAFNVGGIGTVTLSMQYDLSGGVTLSWDGDLEAGFEYTKDSGFRVISYFQNYK